MRKPLLGPVVIFVMAAWILSCHKDNPSAPSTPAYAVTLEYRNYRGDIYCFRLMVGTNPINRCGLGKQTTPVWAGDYECKLYAVRGSGPQETLILIASSPLHLDRNFTCVVDGADIYWWYWG